MAMGISSITVASAVHFLKRLFFDPKLFWTFATLVIVADAILTQLIIRFVPFTEIDWETYMHHVKIYLDGERDYSAISGPTGPLVYPAGHVYVHALLYKLTDAGKNLALSQQVYASLYIASLVVSCAIYRQAGGVPNWVVLLLSLSKRLHSIYVLRLFNDVWAVILTQLSILALGYGLSDISTLLFSVALSVKMSVLLYLPAFLVVLVKKSGLATTVRLCFTIFSVQVLLGYPFLLEHPLPYVKGAFDFGRVFLYKWTVNWRFLSEDRFLDPKFAIALLVGHASVLVMFGLFRWCRSAGGAMAVLNRAIRRPSHPGSPVPIMADGAFAGLENALSHSPKALHRGGNRVRVERVSINSIFLCGVVCIPRRTFGRDLVRLSRREMRAGSGFRTVEPLDLYCRQHRDFELRIRSSSTTMSAQRVVVTYSAPQTLLSSDYWKHIHSALLGQLPLRNIHWKSQTRPSIRTIQELEVQLVPLDAVRDENTSQVPYSLLERPLVNIYVITCEDSDAYKTTAKKQIKDWQTSLNHRKNQEWIILHVLRSDTRNASSNFFQMRGNVLDKIRADFNTDKRDRCVQLAWPMAKDNPAAWAELLSKVKDGILSAFDTAVSSRDEEVRRSESQQSMPGWNFCTFFILKESLAASFEGMNLFEDALRCHDELEFSFAHVLREKNLSWFGTLIIPAPKDDYLPLLSVTKKPYRDLIVANTISVFDLRIYILSNQCTLLGKMGKVTDVCRRVAVFLASFGRHLREVSVILPPYFIESWTYSSALSTLEQADIWANNNKLEGIALNQFNASKAELLELARNQLDVLGIALGFLPSKPPFSMSLPSVPVVPQEARRESRIISNPELLKCLGDQAVYYDLYIKLTNRAIEAYVKAGRRKFALRLHGSLAALDVHRDRLKSALQTYSSLPAHYSPHRWTSLESYVLSKAIDIYALSGIDKDKQWIAIALSCLKSYSGGGGSEGESLIPHTDSTTYITNLVSSLKAVVDKLSEPFVYSEHPALTIRLLGTTAEPAEDEDGFFLQVSVTNSLPCALPANEICLSLSGRDSERLQFSAQVASLEPGSSTFKAFCPTSSRGTYILDQTEVMVSNLRLELNHRTTTKNGKASRTKRSTPTLVRLVKDARAFNVRLIRPRSVVLGPGVSSKLLLAISTGRNYVSKVKLKLTGPPDVTFLFKESTLEGDVPLVSLECAEDCVSLVDLDENSEISVLIPHSDASAHHTMQITIIATYNTKLGAGVERSLSHSSRVPVSLPVAVNVQDFFRGERLFSRFTVSATVQHYVRVSSARLESGNEHKGPSIFGTLSHTREIITITPARPAHFLFELVSQYGRVLDPLSLCIKYRMLRDEVEAVLDQVVDETLNDFPVHHSCRSLLIAHTLKALDCDSGWVEPYVVTGELRVPELSEDSLPKEVISRIRELLAKGRPPDTSDASWREIRIQVDVPLMEILAAVRLRVLAPTPELADSDQLPSLYAGQPIQALLSIQTSFHWGTRQDANHTSYQMRFDIEEMVRDWLISGRKRGDFEAKDGSVFTVPITLIALHHGELSLPKVMVSSLPVVGEIPTMESLSLPNTETHQVHGAEKVLILPRGGRSTFIVGMGEGSSY